MHSIKTGFFQRQRGDCTGIASGFTYRAVRPVLLFANLQTGIASMPICNCAPDDYNDACSQLICGK
jgi:hypothetical protein